MHRYYFLLRPPFIGTHPKDGWQDGEVWSPKQPIPPQHQIEGGAWTAHGWAEYDRQLTFDEVWNYDLHPADEQERNAYIEWREEERK